MHFEIDGHEVYVKFTHFPDYPNYGYMCTQVEIESGLLPEGGVMGEAFCHPNDQFCKKTGRKLALDRALYVEEPCERERFESKACNHPNGYHKRLVSREFSTKFWENYFKQQPYDKVRFKKRRIQLPDGTFIRASEVKRALEVAKIYDNAINPMQN